MLPNNAKKNARLWFYLFLPVILRKITELQAYELINTFCQFYRCPKLQK